MVRRYALIAERHCRRPDAASWIRFYEVIYIRNSQCSSRSALTKTRLRAMEIGRRDRIALTARINPAVEVRAVYVNGVRARNRRQHFIFKLAYHRIRRFVDPLTRHAQPNYFVVDLERRQHYVSVYVIVRLYVERVIQMNMLRLCIRVRKLVRHGLESERGAQVVEYLLHEQTVFQGLGFIFLICGNIVYRLASEKPVVGRYPVGFAENRKL